MAAAAVIIRNTINTKKLRFIPSAPFYYIISNIIIFIVKPVICYVQQAAEVFLTRSADPEDGCFFSIKTGSFNRMR